MTDEFEAWVRDYGQREYGNPHAFTVDDHKMGQMFAAYCAGRKSGLTKGKEIAMAVQPCHGEACKCHDCFASQGMRAQIAMNIAGEIKRK